MTETQNVTPVSRPPLNQHYLSIPGYLILTIVTCGIFNLYWNYRQMLACNDMVGRQEFDWLTWFILCLITCGLYHLFYQYKMGSIIVEIQQKRAGYVFDSLPVISIVVSVLGASIAVDAIHQHEINKLCS